MSSRAHRRPRRERIDAEQTAAIALATARARGCKCEPDLTRRHIGGAVFVLEVAHDPDCPACPEDDQ